MIPSLSCCEGVDEERKQIVQRCNFRWDSMESSDLIFHFPPRAVPTRSTISRTFLLTASKLPTPPPTMALRDEQDDILGGPILQRPESGLFTTFSRYHFVFKSATLLGLGLLVWIVCARGLEHLKKHRELRYRKYVFHPDAFIFL